MAIRVFMDDRGRSWRVWEVRPLSGTVLLGAAGWLCFESAEERRRLASIPQGWEELEDEVLRELCRRAEPESVPPG